MAKTKFPILSERPKRRLGRDDKDLRFFLSTKYDYVNQIWKSGVFKLDEKLWDKQESDGMLQALHFPIEGIDLTVSNLAQGRRK